MQTPFIILVAGWWALVIVLFGTGIVEFQTKKPDPIEVSTHSFETYKDEIELKVSTRNHPGTLDFGDGVSIIVEKHTQHLELKHVFRTDEDLHTVTFSGIGVEAKQVPELIEYSFETSEDVGIFSFRTGDYPAEVNWGDGSTSTAGSNSVFKGRHTFRTKEPSHTVTFSGRGIDIYFDGNPAIKINNISSKEDQW